VKTIVLDCSVAAAWCLADEHSEEAAAVLQQLAKTEALVPPLWPLEMANVLLVAERRGRIEAADASRAVELLLSLPITVVRDEPRSALVNARLLAREHGLSAYDAAYLSLALRSGAALASTDRELVRAAKAAGVKLVLT
jgi:predicted nucleic acid-binding protein